jgi:hypothetical protein
MGLPRPFYQRCGNIDPEGREPPPGQCRCVTPVSAANVQDLRI